MKRLFNLLGLASILTLLVFFSCEKEDSESNACNVSDPAEELLWLKSILTDLSEFDYIMVANYKGSTVFYNGNCNPVVNYVSVVYNCDGDVIANTYDIRGELSNDRLLWKHADSKCNFSD